MAGNAAMQRREFFENFCFPGKTFVSSGKLFPRRLKQQIWTFFASDPFVSNHAEHKSFSAQSLLSELLKKLSHGLVFNIFGLLIKSVEKRIIYDYIWDWCTLP